MTIEQRLSELEGQLRRARGRNRWLLAAAGMGIIIAAGLWTLRPADAQAQADGKRIIRAEGFVLIDADGKERASLAMGPAGPVLLLLDENGKARAMLSAGKDGGGLYLKDEAGLPRAAMTGKNDSSMLNLFDEKSVPRAVLVASARGTSLLFSDSNARTRAALNTFEGDLDPRLDLYDADGKRRAHLGAEENQWRLILSDAEGKPVWQAPR